MNFWIQACNPRSIRALDEEDESIFDALQNVFPMWTEEAFMVWDRIHIPLGYKYIISFIIYDVLEILEALMHQEQGTLEVTWPSNDFAGCWQIHWEGQEIEIHARWDSMVGRSESLLNALPPLVMNKNDFVSEWKQVLGFALRALTEAGYQESQLRDLAMLRRVYEAIEQPGILYRTIDDEADAAPGAI